MRLGAMRDRPRVRRPGHRGRWRPTPCRPERRRRSGRRAIRIGVTAPHRRRAAPARAPRARPAAGMSTSTAAAISARDVIWRRPGSWRRPSIDPPGAGMRVAWIGAVRRASFSRKAGCALAGEPVQPLGAVVLALPAGVGALGAGAKLLEPLLRQTTPSSHRSRPRSRTPAWASSAGPPAASGTRGASRSNGNAATRAGQRQQAVARHARVGGRRRSRALPGCRRRARSSRSASEKRAGQPQARSGPARARRRGRGR